MTRQLDCESELIRKKKAIDRFVSIFKGSYEKLGPGDAEYRVFDKNKNLIAYAQVFVRLKNMNNAYELPVPVNAITKLYSKRLNPTIIWACDDGIIYGKVKDIVGSIRVIAVKKNGIADYESELVAYYPKQSGLKYIRFT